MVSEQEFIQSFPQQAPKSLGSGHPGNLTADQAKNLELIRALLQANGYTERLDDATLLRFLRARKFDVQKAMVMYENCEKWRQEFGTNTILEDFHYAEKEKVMKYYPQFYHKTDKEGRPVYYEILGKVNIPEMYKITTQERMLKNLVWEYEAFVRYRLPASSRMVGHLVETSCTIMDLKGVSLTTASQVYGYLKEASSIGQNYYPERMGKFYLINVPLGFSTVWSFIKRFLDPVTVSKVHIYGSSYKKQLLKQIPAENLPQEFGGTSVPVAGGDLYLDDAGPWRDVQFIGPEGEAPTAAGQMGVVEDAVTAKEEIPPPAPAPTA